MDNYNDHHNCRETDKKEGRVSLYINKINLEPCKDLNMSTPITESVFAGKGDFKTS